MNIAADYRQNSHVILKGAIDPTRVERLLDICERVHTQWRNNPLTDNPPAGPNATYMRHLNHPDYHRDHTEDLAFLLDVCAEPILLETLATVLDEPLLFMNISLRTPDLAENTLTRDCPSRGQD